MKKGLLLALLSCSLTAGYTSGTNNAIDVLIVVGAPGVPQYVEGFSAQVQDWLAACRKAGKSFHVIDAAAGTNELAEVKRVLGAQTRSEQELWITLIGHGTFDGKEAKFNLSGPDLSALEMKALLEPIQRSVILIDTSSASAPFINELSATNRIIITATRSGWEENLTRFGGYFAKSLSDLEADLDKDGQVSALEAFLTAARRVEDFYKGERRLSTEHALIDDNGDGKGTPANFYRGVRPAKKPDEAASVDGFRAHQIQFIPNELEAKLPPAIRKRRNELELTLEQHRARKSSLSETDYLKEIEPILLELSKLYHDAGEAAGKSAGEKAAGAKPAE